MNSNNASSPCDVDSVTDDFLLFYNNTFKKFNASPNGKFNTTESIETFICAYWSYIEYTDYWRLVNGCIRFVCSILGLISSILVLITLWKDDSFSALCFNFFRLINILEIFYMIRMMVDGFYSFYYQKCSKSYHCAWAMTLIRPPVGNMFAICVNLLVIFLSLERALACLAPVFFNQVNQPKVYWMVGVGSMMVSVGFCLPQIFAYEVIEDATSHKYVSILSNFGQRESYRLFSSIGLDGFLYMQAVAAVMTSLLSGIGLIKVIRRKIRLTSKVVDYRADNQTISIRDIINMDSIAKTLNVCYLQISQSTPIAINLAVFALSKNILDVYIGSMEDIYSGYRAYHIRLVSYMTDCLAHCFHFYAYLAFSKVFRQAFKRKFGRE